MFNFCYQCRIVVLAGVLFCSSAHAENVLDFGRVRTGSSQLDTLIITNESLVPLMISNINIMHAQFGLPARAFTSDNITIAPGMRWELPVSFSPLGTHIVSTQLNIETDFGERMWGLKGEGVREVVVINEVLADPASGERGDANGDGVRNSNEDEFVELLNTGQYAIDIGGWQLFDQGTSEAKRLRFPIGTWIDPSERIVVFGGGSVANLQGKVFVDDGKIGGGLRNAGDAVFLVDTGQDTLARMVYGADGGKNQSLVRWPEGTGAWQLHGAFPGNGKPYSPANARTVVSQLQLFPQSTSVSQGDTLHITAQKVYSDASVEEIDSEELAFSPSDTKTLIPVTNNIWLAQQPGTVQVVGQFGDLFYDTLSVTVQPPRIVALKAVIEDSVLLVGDTVSLIVQGTDSQGKETVLVGGFDVAVGDSSVLGAQGGDLKARGPGTSHISVTYDVYQSEIDVLVVERGDLNADGNHTLWDAVRTVHLILGLPPASRNFERRAADVVADSVLDIRDLIAVIQLVLGGPVVSKPAKVLLPIGWKKETDGILVFVPEQTAVLHFEMALPGGDLTIETKLGQVFIQHDVDKVTGMIIVEEVDKQEYHAPVLIKGLPSHSLPKWTAWTLDGAAYPLEPITQVQEPLNLLRTFPNPANPATTIDFVIPFEQDVFIDVYTVSGQWVCRLVGGLLQGGYHQIVWNGRDARGYAVASGVYFVRLRGGEASATLKMVILR